MSQQVVVQGDGRLYWAAGFATCVPFIGGLAILILPIILAEKSRNDPNPLVRENAKTAANWHLTAALVIGGIAITSYLLAAASFIFLVEDLFSVGVVGLILVYPLVGIHFVVTIIGTVRSGDRIFRPRFSIRFFR
ncbi:DUF4870 domain-containing protein [Leucobacter viscericola]|uniref:DUF4870 domain-containing protein n=1 Tax=Leucobacter viscericola TaxID=2714935 RepID=A0A6G7XGQ3_9MICO|nr:DUF4870 domain-containing protein [Leucobacter viscericola]QIK63784.1 DUF4870 domain-containing protein [Leucobacter viscericola]